jgi:hypothetical protein
MPLLIDTDVLIDCLRDRAEAISYLVFTLPALGCQALRKKRAIEADEVLLFSGELSTACSANGSRAYLPTVSRRRSMGVPPECLPR